MKEVSSLKAEVEASRQRSGPGALKAAENSAAELRTEVAKSRQELAAAEHEGMELEAEQHRMEKEEEPLFEWVEHVERELRLARAENNELSKSLVALSDQRASLQRDELDAQSRLPHPKGLPHMEPQVEFLEEQERENAAKKTALLEEIAAHRQRRERYLEEAAGISGGSSLQDASPNRRGPATNGRGPATAPQITSKSLQGKSPALGHLPSPPAGTFTGRQLRSAAAVTQPVVETYHSAQAPVSTVVNVSKPGEVPAHGAPQKPSQQTPQKLQSSFGAGRMPRTISPARRLPMIASPVDPLPSNAAHERPNSPLLSAGPTPLSQLIARGAANNVRGHQVQLPDLPDPYSSDEEDSPGQAGYWTRAAHDPHDGE